MFFFCVTRGAGHTKTPSIALAALGIPTLVGARWVAAKREIIFCVNRGAVDTEKSAENFYFFKR